MAVYKDKWNGYSGDTWRVACYYKDWQGNRKKHEKRGFKTKKEATAYEREYLAKRSKDINMGFGTFIDIYMADLKPQIKPTTYVTKENIIEAHIRPYFSNKSLSEISSTDCRTLWIISFVCLPGGGKNECRSGKQELLCYSRTGANPLCRGQDLWSGTC